MSKTPQDFDNKKTGAECQRIIYASNLPLLQLHLHFRCVSVGLSKRERGVSATEKGRPTGEIEKKMIRTRRKFAGLLTDGQSYTMCARCVALEAHTHES